MIIKKLDNTKNNDNNYNYENNDNTKKKDINSLSQKPGNLFLLHFFIS